MAGAKNSAKSTGRRGNPQYLIPWKKGQSGNPAGRGKGVRDRRTVIWDAIKRIAAMKDMAPEDVEEAIQAAGIDKALKGSFLHYAELSNGLYGKVTDRLDLTSGGKTLADVFAKLHGKRSRKTTGANKK